MNANPKFITPKFSAPVFNAQTAHVDAAAIKPLPNSRKVYVQGSRPDLLVPMREISQAETPASMGAETNPPIYVFDCSVPYSDPAVMIDILAVLAALREGWIAERVVTETLY